MDTLTIIEATTTDVDQLQSIGRQTFYETFAAMNSEENMTQYLQKSFSREKLLAELNDKNTKTYFAKLGNKVIGYLKLNRGPSQTEMKELEGIEIERIYVLKEFHGRKAGQALFRKAMEVAAQANAGYIWLGVWEHNQKAIRFYEQNGFVAFDKHIFKLGKDEQTDLMMKRELS